MPGRVEMPPKSIGPLRCENAKEAAHKKSKLQQIAGGAEMIGGPATMYGQYMCVDCTIV